MPTCGGWPAKRPCQRAHPAPRVRYSTRLATALCTVLSIAVQSSARAEDGHGIQLTLEAYVDDATHRAETNIGNISPVEEEAEVGRSLSFALSANYLIPIIDRVRLGPGVRYLSSYRYRPDDAEEDDENADVLIGRLFEVYLRGEFLIELPGALSLTPALELGVPVLFAAGDLQRQLDGRERLGYSVNQLPRIGLLLGAELAVRYKLTPFLFLRAGLGLQHDRLILYDAEVDDGAAETSRTLNLMRIRVLTGAEVQF